MKTHHIGQSSVHTILSRMPEHTMEHIMHSMEAKKEAKVLRLMFFSASNCHTFAKCTSARAATDDSIYACR